LNLTKEDPKRIGDILIEYLKEIVSFKTGRFWYDESSFPDIEISSRQRQRAEEALSKGEAFWDRVGNNIFIPLASSIFIMENVSRNLDINCETVILKLLKDNIIFRLIEIKKKTFHSLEGETPEYFIRTIKQLISAKVNSCIIYIEKTRDYSSGEAASLLNNLFSDKELEQTGIENDIEWWVGYRISPYEIQKAIRQFNHISFHKKSINKIIFIPLSEHFSLPEDYIININYIRNLCRILRLRISSVENLGEFLKFFDVDIYNNKNFLHFIAPCLKLEERIKKKRSSFFISLLNNFVFDCDNNEIFDEKILISDNKCFLIKYIPEKSQEDDIIASYRDKMKSLFNKNCVGGTAFYQKQTGMHFSLMDIFCTYIHAKLLGEASFVFFDHTTFNIKGDEYYSLGDLKNAVSSYKKAFELSNNDLRIINSLGASLAEIGYRSLAEKNLLKGIAINDNDPSILYNLAGIYISNGKSKDAESLMERAHKIRPDDIPVMVRYAETLLNLKKSHIAERILSPLFEAKREDIPLSAYKIMAKALYDDDRKWKKSMELLNLALKKNPFDIEPYLLLARGYIEKEKDPVTARLILEKVDVSMINNPSLILIYKNLKSNKNFIS